MHCGLYWQLDTGHWLLAVGHLALAMGCWTLGRALGSLGRAVGALVPAARCPPGGARAGFGCRDAGPPLILHSLSSGATGTPQHRYWGKWGEGGVRGGLTQWLPVGPSEGNGAHWVPAGSCKQRIPVSPGGCRGPSGSQRVPGLPAGPGRCWWYWRVPAGVDGCHGVSVDVSRSRWVPVGPSGSQQVPAGPNRCQ